MLQAQASGLRRGGITSLCNTSRVPPYSHTEPDSSKIHLIYKPMSTLFSSCLLQTEFCHTHTSPKFMG